MDFTDSLSVNAGQTDGGKWVLVAELEDNCGTVSTHDMDWLSKMLKVNPRSVAHLARKNGLETARNKFRLSGSMFAIVLPDECPDAAAQDFLENRLLPLAMAAKMKR